MLGRKRGIGRSKNTRGALNWRMMAQPLLTCGLIGCRSWGSLVVSVLGILQSHKESTSKRRWLNRARFHPVAQERHATISPITASFDYFCTHVRKEKREMENEQSNFISKWRRIGRTDPSDILPFITQLPFYSRHSTLSQTLWRVRK